MKSSQFEAELLFQVLQNYKTALQRGFKSKEIHLSALDAKILKLIAHRGINTPQMLAEYSGRDKAQVTRLLTDMEQRELLEKVPHPTDKRSVCLVLSGKALGLVAQIRQIDNELRSQMLLGLNEEQQQVLGLLLQKIADNLK